MATIQLTDGTTTLNLFDTSSYNLIDESWSPAVATRRQDSLGGSPYSDVVETLALRIKGTSTADCLDKLHNLTVLLDQADRWRMGESVAAVLFKYKPTGSAANVLSAAVLGTPVGQAAVIVPGRVEWIEGNSFQLFPVIVTFLRRGAWLDNEESDASSSVANPGILTATNTVTDLPSPVKLSMTNFTSTPWGGSFLLVTDDADKLDVFSVSTLTATGFTTVNDASKTPLQGTNVLRYTPTDTAWHYSGTTDIKALQLSDTRQIAVFFNARRNASTTGALAKIKVQPVTGGYNTLAVQETPSKELIYTVPSGSAAALTEPQWYFAGIINLPVAMSVVTNMYLSIGVKASVAASTIDFDAVCLMDVRSRASQAIFIPSNDAYGLLNTLTVDHLALSEPSPRAYFTAGSIVLNLPADGNRFITGQAAEVSSMWLTSGQDTTGPGYRYWCGVNLAGAKLSNVLTAVRRPAFLVPQ